MGKFSEDQAQIVVGALLAMLTPYITALITTRKMSDHAKIAVSALVALVAAIVTMWLTGKLNNVADVATAWALIWPASQTFYRNIALKLGIRRVEELTTPASQKTEDKPLPTASTIEAAGAMAAANIQTPEAVAEATERAILKLSPEGAPAPVEIASLGEQIKGAGNGNKHD